MKDAEAYLVALLSRFLDLSNAPDPTSANGQTTSWEAHREAEKIADSQYLPILSRVIENSKNKKEREACYFIYANIAGNTKAENAGDILLKYLQNESDKYVISFTLDLLERRELRFEDYALLLPFLRHSKWLIRHSAMGAAVMATRGFTELERELLSCLQGSNDKYDCTYIFGALAKIGSKACIPAIKAKLRKLTDSDALFVGLNALGSLDGAGSNDIFEHFLSEAKNSGVKDAALLQLTIHGTESHGAAILARIKKIVSTKRKYECVYTNSKPPLVEGLRFLLKNTATEESARDVYNWLMNKRSEYLQESEKQWLIENKQLFSRSRT